MVRRAEIAQPSVRFGGDPLGQRLGEAGLADARLGGNQHHPAVAGLRLRPAAEQQVDLLVAANQRRDGPVQCLEPAFGHARANHLPDRHVLGEALKGDVAEIAILEQAADLPPGGSVDHHLPRPREALETGGEVRRLADRRLLTRVAGADRLANDHKSRRDANADLKRWPPTGASLTAAATARPARTARSASVSRASGQPK